jgi:mannose-6-phosphate isomerase-like protein (cupin superfamily)
MSSIVVVNPQDGEQIAVGPMRFRIIEDGSNTSHRIGLIEVVVPAGPAVPPPHVHREHDELFLITRGRLRFTSGDESVDVGAGACVTVPAGVPHTFSNPFDEAGTFIAAMTPDLYIEYFRDLTRLPLGENGLPSPADIGKTMARYATDAVVPANA